MRRRLFKALSILSLALCLVSVVMWVRSARGIDSLAFGRFGRIWWIGTFDGHVEVAAIDLPGVRLDSELTLLSPRTHPPRVLPIPVAVFEPGRTFHLRGLFYQTGVASYVARLVDLPFDPYTATSVGDPVSPSAPRWRLYDDRPPVRAFVASRPYRAVVAHLALVTALFGLGAIPLVLSLARTFMRHRRAIKTLCPACGYNLTANTSGVCPECGTGTTAGITA